MNIPGKLQKVREIKLTSESLISFESELKKIYEDGKIKAPIHLSKGNEKELLEIFQYVHINDWVFSSWRNHYHALLHGINRDVLLNDIINGNSMNHNLNISSDIMKVDEIVSNFYWYISFTLTVRAVNDAPVLLQPFEDFEILED